MTLIDVNQSRLGEIENPLGPLPFALPTQRLAQLTLQPVTGVSLFVLSLFIPFENSFNVAYSLPMNHRMVDQGHLLDKTKFKFSIAEGVYEDATCKCLWLQDVPSLGSTWMLLLTRCCVLKRLVNSSHLRTPNLRSVFFR